jgi:hypothetical protein
VHDENEVHRVPLIMVGIREALSPDTQEASHWMLCLRIPPLRTVSRAANSKTAHRRISSGHVKSSYLSICCKMGRAIAQAVSRRQPISVARVWSQVRSCGICCGQSGTGAGLLLVFRFPLPIRIPPNASYSCIIRGWYNRPISGRRIKWTRSYPTPRN